MDFLEDIKEKIVPASIGGIAIFVVSYFLEVTKSKAIIFASLGASTVILSEYPDIKMAKLHIVIKAYIVAMLIGLFCSMIPFHPLAAGLSVFATIMVMLYTDTVHPPAGGAALAFVYSKNESMLVAMSILSLLILLIIIKSIIYLYKKELHISKFHHEFRDDKTPEMADKKAMEKEAKKKGHI